MKLIDTKPDSQTTWEQPHQELRQHTIANAKFTLFATSCADFPRLTTSCACSATGGASSLYPGRSANAAGHMTEVLVANQHPENLNDITPPCGQELQIANVHSSDLKWHNFAECPLLLWRTGCGRGDCAAKMAFTIVCCLNLVTYSYLSKLPQNSIIFQIL